MLVAENPDDPARPKTYTPIQYRFPDGETFKHSDMKWVDYDKMSAFPVDDPALDARVRDVSARFFVALDGASFGRCDLRVDAQRHALHAGDQSQLRRLLPARGRRQRRPLPRARSGRPCRLHAPADRGRRYSDTKGDQDKSGVRAPHASTDYVIALLYDSVTLRPWVARRFCRPSRRAGSADAH